LEKLDTLEAGAIHLKESSKKMKTLCESWASERERLQRFDVQYINNNEKDWEFSFSC